MKEPRFVSIVLALACVLTGRPVGAQTTLPGVGSGTVTPETFQEFVRTVKMVQPPPGLPQKWFSAQAESIATVAGATADAVTVVEPLEPGAFVDLQVRVVGPSAAAGQIRKVASNSIDAIDVSPSFDVIPEPGDTVEVFTGSLPPGRWDGACTQADPCLDINEAFLLAAADAVWLWFDSGDVWDSDDEWCDFTNSPPGRCLDPSNPFRHRILVEEYEDAAAVDEIRWGVSGTDLTGETFAVFDCDAAGNYPPFGGGVFENQNGSSAPPSNDHPTPWLVVQGMETRCWNRPAPGTVTAQNEWGEGASIYKREFSGKLLAIHNRHGELWDDAALVKGNGHNFSNGDTHVGGIILVDVEASTADYGQMVGQCVATNDPYRSCQGTEFTGEGRASGGADIRPRFVSALGGGAVLWIGGDAPLRNQSAGPYAGAPRHVVHLGGFHDYFSNSGAGGTQHLTMVNLQVEGTPGDTSPADAVVALPQPDRWGTTFDVKIINSRFTGLPDGAAALRFYPGWETTRATDTALESAWVNVEVADYGSVFVKEHSVFDEVEVDAGFDWTGRCLFVDGARPIANVSRVLDIRSSTAELTSRCMRHGIDLEGWFDGDDVVHQLSLCFTDPASYASEAMAGELMDPGHAGDVNGWQIFATGNSGDWGGEGVEIDARGKLSTSTEVQDAVVGGCDHSAVYPLGQTLPVGFISTSSNRISSILVDGVRDLGYNPAWGQAACVGPGQPVTITTVSLDAGGRPVLHYTDPNAPGETTGYNVYRSSSPAGPWVLIGDEVGDMDDFTPDLQFVDATGQNGDGWYYRIAPTDGACEGP